MRRTPKFDRELAARVIAEAVAGGDEATCDKHGITLRTLQRWRKRLENDNSLSLAVAEKKAIVEADWAAKLPTAISGCIEFIAEAAKKADRRDPDAVHAIAGAMKLLTDVALAKQMLDVRLARQARQAGAGAGSGVGSDQNVITLRPALPAASGLRPGGEPKVSTS